ncbi:MAG: hypothetical protein JNG86_10975 [Verrucomicrobiaceae bacterium]|nr:hypothetical protein [Verrucomicrobiaceae bacterium]
MNENEPTSGPNFTKAGLGAMGDVNNVYDASRHTTNHTTNHSSSTSQAHHEDKSQHIDQSVTKQTTVHQSGLSQTALFAIICVVVAGFVLVILAMNNARTPTPPLADAGKILPAPEPPAKQPVDTGSTAKDASAPKAEPRVSPPSPPPSLPSDAGLQLVFDRADRTYYDQDKQALRITVPKRGYLYAASVWADGQMRILCHPAILTPKPGAVEAGQTVDVPVINMSFTPPDPSAATTEEEIRVVLSDTLLPGIPADRRADIRTAWEAALGVEVGSPDQRMRVRGGELPLPEPFTQPSSGLLQHTAPYRMICGPRPVSAP